MPNPNEPQGLQRSPFETDEQWERRKQMMERHNAFVRRITEAATISAPIAEPREG